MEVDSYEALVAKRDLLVEESKRIIGSFKEVRLSYWSFSAYKTCPQKYVLQCVGRRPKPPKIDSFWATTGAVVHTQFENYIKGLQKGVYGWDDMDAVLKGGIPDTYDKFIEEEYVDWAKHETTPAKHREENLPKMVSSVDFMTTLLTREGFIPRDPRTMHVERPFKTELMTGVELTGRPDLVFENETSFDIVDFKDVTNRSNAHWRQLIWYVLGLEPIFQKPVNRTGFLLTRLRDYSWRNPNAKDYRNTLKAEILDTVLRIRRGPFPARVSRHHCGICDVQSLCPEYQRFAGRSNNILNSIALMGEGNAKF